MLKSHLQPYTQLKFQLFEMLALRILDKIALVQNIFWPRLPIFWDPQHHCMQVTSAFTQILPWLLMQIVHGMYCVYIILFLTGFPGLTASAPSLSSAEDCDPLFILFLCFILALGICVQVTAFTMIKYPEEIAAAIKAVTQQTLQIATKTGRYYIFPSMQEICSFSYIYKCMLF